MRYKIVVSPSHWADMAPACSAVILDSDDREVVGLSGDLMGDNAYEAIGKAVLMHPELFPGVEVEIDGPERKLAASANPATSDCEE
jgi:hypothetical protein